MDSLRAKFVLAVIACAVTRATAASSGNGFLAPTEAELSLRELASIYGGFIGTDARVFRRLAAIERSINATYMTLPKNTDGRLGTKGVRHIVQSYFSKEHGWLLKGLDQRHLVNVTDVHEAVIFKDMVPDVERSMIQSLHADTGSSLGDVVALLAVFEHLISQESLSALKAAYERNGLSTTSVLRRNEVDIVLQTYLWMLHEDGKEVSQEQWVQFLTYAPKYEPAFVSIVQFESDAVLNFFYEARHATNPFFHSLTFEAVSTVLEGLVRDHGKWQQNDCKTIKNALTIVDPEVTGRVPLGTFYAQPHAPTHMFVETADDLRTMGALEETPEGSYVRIVNYLLGPSNCIAHSNYYCTCCLSECEKIIDELNEEILAPTAEPQRILWLVENMTSETKPVRAFGKDMTDKLYAIAARNAGEVPLHGRMFAQWLHYAFPQECPYPHVMGSVTKVLDPAMWLGDGAPVVDAIEKEVHVNAIQKRNTYAALEAQASQWSEEEILPLAEEGSPAFRVLFRASAMLVLLAASVRFIHGLWRGGVGAARRLQSGRDAAKDFEWTRSV